MSNTKGKYGKVTGTKIKQSIISKSVTIIIFVEFTDQLIDSSINCASLTVTSRLRPILNSIKSASYLKLSKNGFHCLLTWCMHRLQRSSFHVYRPTMPRLHSFMILII